MPGTELGARDAVVKKCLHPICPVMLFPAESNWATLDVVVGEESGRAGDQEGQVEGGWRDCCRSGLCTCSRLH